MNPESLVYTTDLYYTPTPYGHHLIVRTSATKIPIACIYSRKDNVSSHAVKPLSKLFTSSISSDHVMNFSLRLMNAEWTGERLSNVLNFGDLLHIEASVGLPLQVPLRLYIHNCTATPTPDENSTIKYAIIDNYGCLRDGRSNSSSSVFKIPRIQQNKLQFYLTPFRFYKDTRNTVFISCFLKAILTEHLADKINKACSFSKQENRWLPVEGPEDICECCETESCEEVTKLPGKNNLHKNHSKRDLHAFANRPM
ncbi:zona pellucida sperm-binding protein 3-like isoform X2 [Protopterus annectens]|nr:zona pellucida sperm-binding protein 3-like isoform X2 [Protopterus annectens]